MKTFKEFLREQAQEPKGPSKDHFVYHLQKAVRHSLVHDASNHDEPEHAKQRDYHNNVLAKHYGKPREHETVLDHFYIHADSDESRANKNASARSDIESLYHKHYAPKA